MSRKRLTREDSRDLTTQRLLDAAQRLIAKKGLSAASAYERAGLRRLFLYPGVIVAHPAATRPEPSAMNRPLVFLGLCLTSCAGLASAATAPAAATPAAATGPRT